MALNFKLRVLLWLNSFKKVPPLHKIPAQVLRRENRETVRRIEKIIQYPPEKLFEIKDVQIPVGDTNIGARIYKPTSETNLPVLIYYHGGGFVIGNLESHDNNCRRLAKHNNMIVVSVDYRLAPEYKFPTGPNDCYAALLWIHENIAEYGGNPAQLAVGGDSAGANLSTVVCMMVKEKGGPKISLQVLIYPCTDATLSCHTIETNGVGYILTKELMQWFLGHYIEEGTDLKTPYLSPLFADDLSDLPPALLITAEFDPLRDEGEKYAKKLKAAGVPVVYKEYKGMVHAFFVMTKFLKSARDLEIQIGEEIKKAFNTSNVKERVES